MRINSLLKKMVQALPQVLEHPWKTASKKVSTLFFDRIRKPRDDVKIVSYKEAQEIADRNWIAFLKSFSQQKKP